MRKIKDIIIKESIISNSDLGRDVIIKKFIEDIMHASPKSYSVIDGNIQLWGVDKGENKLLMKDVIDNIHFNFFEPGVTYYITVDGDDEYDKFLNTFLCNIGSYDDKKRNHSVVVEIKNVNKTIKWNDFYYMIYGELRFSKCSRLDFNGGLPRVSGLLSCVNCKNIEKPYDLQNIEKLKF